LKRGVIIELTDRQKEIVRIVKRNGPISGEDIAAALNLSRTALRADLAVLTMTGYLGARPRVGYYYSGNTVNSLLVEHLRSTKVSDLMSVPVILRSDQSVYDAVVTIFLEDVGTLIVIDDQGLLAGVISRKDLLKSLLGNVDTNKIPLQMIMTRMPNIHFTTEHESIWEAARKIVDYEVDCLPVVREAEDGREGFLVSGRISKTTIAKLFVELGGR